MKCVTKVHSTFFPGESDALEDEGSWIVNSPNRSNKVDAKTQSRNKGKGILNILL